MSLESDNRLVKPQLGNAGIRHSGQNKASGTSLPHIVSNTVRIDADEWEVAIFLPVERFNNTDM